MGFDAACFQSFTPPYRNSSAWRPALSRESATWLLPACVLFVLMICVLERAQWNVRRIPLFLISLYHAVRRTLSAGSTEVARTRTRQAEKEETPLWFLRLVPLLYAVVTMLMALSLIFLVLWVWRLLQHDVPAFVAIGLPLTVLCFLAFLGGLRRFAALNFSFSPSVIVLFALSFCLWLVFQLAVLVVSRNEKEGCDEPLYSFNGFAIVFYSLNMVPVVLCVYASFWKLHLPFGEFIAEVDQQLLKMRQQRDGGDMGVGRLTLHHPHTSSEPPQSAGFTLGDTTTTTRRSSLSPAVTDHRDGHGEEHTSGGTTSDPSRSDASGSPPSNPSKAPDGKTSGTRRSARSLPHIKGMGTVVAGLWGMTADDTPTKDDIDPSEVVNMAVEAVDARRQRQARKLIYWLYGSAVLILVGHAVCVYLLKMGTIPEYIYELWRDDADRVPNNSTIAADTTSLALVPALGASSNNSTSESNVDPEDPDRPRLIGFSSVVIIVVLDLVIMFSSRSLGDGFNSAAVLCLLMLACRCGLCITYNYWFVGHAAIFAALGILLSTAIVSKRLPVGDREQQFRRQMKTIRVVQEYISKVNVAGSRVEDGRGQKDYGCADAEEDSMELEDVVIDEPPGELTGESASAAVSERITPRRMRGMTRLATMNLSYFAHWRSTLKQEGCRSPEVLLSGLAILFILEMLVCSLMSDKESVVPKLLNMDQLLYGVVSLLVVACWMVTAIGIRKWQQRMKMTKQIGALLSFSYCMLIGAGALLWALTHQPIILWVAIFAPLGVPPFLIFYAQWVENQFEILRPPAERTPANCNCIRAFFGPLAGGGCHLPATDYKTLGCFSISYIILWCLAIGVSFYQKPSWFGWTAGFVLHQLFGTFLGWKGYFGKLQIGPFQVLCISVLVLAQVAFGVLCSMLVIQRRDNIVDKPWAIMALSFVLVLYFAVVLFAAALARWKDKNWQPNLFSSFAIYISLLSLIAVSLGAAIAFSEKWPLGVGGLLVCLFLAYVYFAMCKWVENRFYMPKWVLGGLAGWIALVLIICAVGATVHYHKGYVFRWISGGYSILLLCVIASIVHLWKRAILKNKTLWIPSTLMPIYKYEPHRGAVRPSYKLPYLVLAAFLMLLLWGMLAAMFVYPVRLGLIVSSLSLPLFMIFVLHYATMGQRALRQHVQALSLSFIRSCYNQVNGRLTRQHTGEIGEKTKATFHQNELARFGAPLNLTPVPAVATSRVDVLEPVIGDDPKENWLCKLGQRRRSLERQGWLWGWVRLEEGGGRPARKEFLSHLHEHLLKIADLDRSITDHVEVCRAERTDFEMHVISTAVAARKQERNQLLWLYRSLGPEYATARPDEIDALDDNTVRRLKGTVQRLRALEDYKRDSFKRNYEAERRRREKLEEQEQQQTESLATGILQSLAIMNDSDQDQGPVFAQEVIERCLDVYLGLAPSFWSSRGSEVDHFDMGEVPGDGVKSTAEQSMAELDVKGDMSPLPEIEAPRREETDAIHGEAQRDLFEAFESGGQWLQSVPLGDSVSIADSSDAASLPDPSVPAPIRPHESAGVLRFFPSSSTMDATPPLPAPPTRVLTEVIQTGNGSFSEVHVTSSGLLQHPSVSMTDLEMRRLLSSGDRARERHVIRERRPYSPTRVSEPGKDGPPSLSLQQRQGHIAVEETESELLEREGGMGDVDGLGITSDETERKVSSWLRKQGNLSGVLRNLEQVGLELEAMQSAADDDIELRKQVDDRLNNWSQFQRGVTESKDKLNELQRLVSQRLKEVRSLCSKLNRKFTDYAFPPNEESLGQGPCFQAWVRNLSWLRPEEVYQRRTCLLCDNEDGTFGSAKDIDIAEEINQGELGDCWFLSALSVLSTRPALMERVFHPEARRTCPYGVYALQFYKDGRVKPVIVDDLVPSSIASDGSVYKCTGLPRCPKFAKPAWRYDRDHHRCPQSWMMLIEKAYAKLHGSYSSIEGGLVHMALVDLTGGFGDIINLRRTFSPTANFDGTHWQKMVDAHRLGYLIGAGSPGVGGDDAGGGEIAGGTGCDGSPWAQDVSPLGIVQGHAYAVLDVREVDAGGGKRYKLIKLRNPWGREGVEWKGDFSDGSHQWTTRLKRLLEYEPLPGDGIFWMSFEDFVNQFDDVYICRVFDDPTGLNGKWCKNVFHGAWTKGLTAGGSTNHTSVTSNPHYVITVKKPTTVYVVLAQKDTRGTTKELHPIALELYAFSKPRRVRKSREDYQALVNKHDCYCALREVSREFYLTPRTYTLLVSTFEPGQEAEFALTIFTDETSEIDIRDVTELDSHKDRERGPKL
ncbi:unnamed protein product [Vitrella brassicaformis CCMP3155]|uniref:Calpain catalytic domain-containing protein n=5 Tax=Vitrella brassicaformis TaxID=1169539 RepID=A0A0G4FDZ9_VITBC|nr:unnamed protein product [Vitrella brassicaformis CCMP3155]|eukprot:CEM11427.1 unnamed protein product [Vitrella brassicaformis CCMP3155]